MHAKGNCEWCVEGLLNSCFLLLSEGAQIAMKRQDNLCRNHWECAKMLKINQDTELSNSYKNPEGEKATRKDTNNTVLLLLIFISWSVLE